MIINTRPYLPVNTNLLKSQIGPFPPAGHLKNKIEDSQVFTLEDNDDETYFFLNQDLVNRFKASIGY